jgi:hypothetical protein
MVDCPYLIPKSTVPQMAATDDPLPSHSHNVPGVECVMQSLNSRQVADSRSYKTLYSSVEEYSPCL